MSATPPVLLEIDALACQRAGRAVFTQLNLHGRAGEICVISGCNGSGKTSLLRAIAGLLPLAAGRIICRADRLFLAHHNALKPALTIRETLRFWAQLGGGGSENPTQILAAFDLAPLADVPVARLSHGQKRRLALSRLCLDPALIWLLDEPDNGLDMPNRQRLYALMTRHVQQGGLILLTSPTGHYPVELAQVPHQSLQLGKGRAA